ncbi:MAG: glucose-1-phosphate adenylyltransferase [Dehalococcoidales bacterium]|nr:glucose-1-phosphate adenylyltransferase [Dehalococcoidales bacterium]
MDQVLAMIMAGGQGDRLQPLTLSRSKSAVPFGGKFRLIDFTLSNCVNSGLRQVFVLTQYRSGSLHMHIQEGWGISSARLGDYIYSVPAQQKVGTDWYQGTADAVRQNIDLMRGIDINYLLILSGDHIYKMDYRQMLGYHQKKNAHLTISAVRVRKEEAAGRLGVLETDDNSKLLGFEEKPVQPKTIKNASDYALASMGIYLFNIDILKEVLQSPGNDFGKDIIPGMIDKNSGIFVYDFEQENKIEDYVVEVQDGKRKKGLVDRIQDSSYWRDVGTIESYYESSMDLVSVNPQFNLYGERWLIRTYQRPLPPCKCVLGGMNPDSIICDGCIISGGIVTYSILSPGVIVEKGALVEKSIIFDDAIIEPQAKVRRAIIDKEARIEAGALVGYDLELDRQRGCTISDTGIVVVPKGASIKPV